MLLAEVVDTSAAVAATRSRLAKIAAHRRRCSRRAEPDEVESSSPTSPARRASGAPASAGARSARSRRRRRRPSLTAAEVDAAFERIAALAGAGSQAPRAAAVAELFGRATADEQAFAARRSSSATSARARSTRCSSRRSRRAPACRSPPSGAPRCSPARRAPVASAALTGGEHGAGASSGSRSGDRCCRCSPPARPTSTAAWRKAGGGEVAVDAQARRHPHPGAPRRRRDRVFTRTWTTSPTGCPRWSRSVRALPGRDVRARRRGDRARPDGRPRPFQETASRAAQRDDGGVDRHAVLLRRAAPRRRRPDRPARRERARALAGLVPEPHRVPRLVTADPAEAAGVLRRALAAGHEGVVVKALDAPYAAGRRGAGWVKVKPVHTLDLVVLAVEWGSRPPAGLALQHPPRRPRPRDRRLRDARQDVQGHDRRDAALADRAVHRARSRPTTADVVHVRPEQVVEIAFDGVQRSTRYPGGMALRFARVLRYRDDKTADEADTIETVRSSAVRPTAAYRPIATTLSKEYFRCMPNPHRTPQRPT